MDIKSFIGITAVVIALGSYVPYFRDMAAGRTKPHAFSWLIWAVLTAIAAAGQLADRGGAGAWVTATSALVCFIVFFYSLTKGDPERRLLDWLSLGGAGVALLLWRLTDSPLFSVVLITLIDLLGFVPTFRKSYTKPHQETVILYFFAAVKFLLGIIALGHYSVITVLYPLSLVLTNSAFVMLVLVRRRALSVSVQIGKERSAK